MLSSCDKKFIENIFQSINNGDIDFFQSACFNYNKIVSLNKENVNILLHIMIKNILFYNDFDEVDIS